MSIESVLLLLDELRTALERMGVTTQVLAITGLIAGAFFVFSFREVLSWFLKIAQLRGEIRAQREQVNQMQKSLEDLRQVLLDQAAAQIQAPLAADANEKRFNLDH